MSTSFKTLIALVLTLALGASSAIAGGILRGGAVGGIHIDAQGVVSTPEIGDRETLLATWQSGLDAVPGDLQKLVDLRFVSLRGIEAQIAQQQAAGEPLPDAVRYLAGLLRVKYVLVYPPTAEKPQGDIVLAGPAEGWKVDSLGNTVGETTNRPVLMLEDLMVALRAAEGETAAISCSIDPTAEGLQRVQRIGRLDPSQGPEAAARKIEQALGAQTVTVSGIPTTSHFARTLVAADFRMKRLAMDFEPAPIDNMPSYLDMLPNRGRITKNMLPRWWLATNYKPVARDEAGNAWEIRGQGVKCMTEEDFVNAEGQRTRSGKANPIAQQWADNLTERFEELANHDSAFGHLRNAMDLSVATAVIAQNDLLRKTKLTTPWLLGKAELEEYNAPRQVASQASLIRKSNKWVISASGGVQMMPWQVAEKTETVAELSNVQQKAAAESSNWWWQ